MANFNFNYTLETVVVEGVPIQLPTLSYIDAQGNVMSIAGIEMIDVLIQKMQSAFNATIAETYTKKTYTAKSLVYHSNKLYYNPNAISTAENWTAAHWTETTIADYIKLMTT